MTGIFILCAARKVSATFAANAWHGNDGLDIAINPKHRAELQRKSTSIDFDFTSEIVVQILHWPIFNNAVGDDDAIKLLQLPLNPFTDMIPQISHAMPWKTISGYTPIDA